VRFAGWFCLVLGVPFLIGAGVVGILAIQQATEISAYHTARPCPAGAGLDADCLRAVSGTVAGVTESPGGDRIPAQWQLDVKTSSTTLHLTFASDNPMLGYALDGNSAVVTTWRGVPVSVVTGGFTEVTTSIPETALASDVGNAEEAGGAGLLFVTSALAIRENGRAGDSRLKTRPALAAAFLGLLMGSLVIMISGWALGGKPSRLDPDLAVTGAAMVLVVGLSVWAWSSARARRVDVDLGGPGRVPGGVHALHGPAVTASQPPFGPAAPSSDAAQPATITRPRPASRARTLGAVALGWLMPGLTVAVLFGVFLTSHDGPPARAYRHAPACVGETNLTTCAGNFTAGINGVRTPANGRNSADISYVTADGVINTWATFDGDSGVLARLAEADKSADTPLTIRVWRGSIVGAQLGSSWHWAEGDPPGDMIPVVFLAVSFGLLLLVVRLRIHRRVASRSRANSRLLIDDQGQVAGQVFADDVGQVIAAAASIVLLAFGYWPGAILALAVLLWLAISVRQSTRRSRMRIAALQSS
jgi:hypothetical protein